MSTIEDIRNKLDIVQIIGQHIKLKPHGKEYLGICPFHGEKTPSFFVNPAKGVFYCFGCQAKGNVFDFYSKFNNVSFNITLQHFANMLGITLAPLSEKELEQKSYKQKLLNLCTLATNYFKDNLHNTNNVNALNYLLNRGLSLATINNFNLGYSLANNNQLWEVLYANGANEEDLLEIGLKAYNSNGIIYEPFKERIIFPIINLNNQTIAFGGRTMLANVQPKYLNSKESLLFSKKENLYGINLAINNVKHSNLIITEGYIDVITLHQHGFNTAVATLGTAITSNHLSFINKVNAMPIFCLDGDSAGQNATLKVAKMYLSLLSNTVNPSFILLKDSDPDSFFANNSAQDFNNLIQNALSVSSVLWHFLSANKNVEKPEEAGFLLEELNTLTNDIKGFNLKQQMQRFFKNQLYLLQRNKTLPNKAINLQKYSNMVEYSREYFLKGCVLICCIVKFAEILSNAEEDLYLLNFSQYASGNIQVNNNLMYLDKLILFILDNISVINNTNILSIIQSNNNAMLWYNKIKEEPLYNITFNNINNYNTAYSYFKSTLNSLLNGNQQVTINIQQINNSLSALYKQLQQIQNTSSNEYKQTYNKINVLLKQLSELKKNNVLAGLNTKQNSLNN